MRWIPIEEQLPEDRQRVLTYRPRTYWRFQINLQRYEECGANDLAWWLGGGHNYVVSEGDITHWQPLPVPPKEDKK